jgi:hypothetical protein
MDLGTTTLLVGGGIGVLLGFFGARMLITGRAPGPTARAFRTVRDAGLYHLLFGSALLVLAVGTSLRKGGPAIVSAVLVVAMVVVAVARHRPRGKAANEDRDGAGDEERRRRG